MLELHLVGGGTRLIDPELVMALATTTKLAKGRGRSTTVYYISESLGADVLEEYALSRSGLPHLFRAPDVRESYVTLKAQLPHLVELQFLDGRPVAINPTKLGPVYLWNDGTVIVRLVSRHGFQVRGTLEAVAEALGTRSSSHASSA